MRPTNTTAPRAAPEASLQPATLVRLTNSASTHGRGGSGRRSGDPEEDPGGMISYTMGDDNLERSFIKLESGNWNGFSAYISRSKTDSDLWRGPGSIDREHIEGKIKYEFDEDTFIKFGYVHNDFFDYDSPSGPESVFEDDYYYG